MIKDLLCPGFQHPVEDGAPDGLELLRLLDRCHHCITVHPLFVFSVVDGVPNGLELLDRCHHCITMHHPICFFQWQMVHQAGWNGWTDVITSSLFFTPCFFTVEDGVPNGLELLHRCHHCIAMQHPVFFQWRIVHQMGWNGWTGVITASLCNTLFFQWRMVHQAGWNC